MEAGRQDVLERILAVWAVDDHGGTVLFLADLGNRRYINCAVKPHQVCSGTFPFGESSWLEAADRRQKETGLFEAVAARRSVRIQP